MERKNDERMRRWGGKGRPGAGTRSAKIEEARFDDSRAEMLFAESREVVRLSVQYITVYMRQLVGLWLRIVGCSILPEQRKRLLVAVSCYTSDNVMVLVNE
jgi:hypothetical protein